jgi:hypothetical protein
MGFNRRKWKISVGMSPRNKPRAAARLTLRCLRKPSARSPPGTSARSRAVATVASKNQFSDRSDCAVAATTKGWGSLFFAASSASLSQATDILVRLALVSGSELLCPISEQCAACSRYSATFSLSGIHPSYVFCRAGTGSAMHNAAADGHLQSQKTLSCQSLRKFNFQTFATI